MSGRLVRLKNAQLTMSLDDGKKAVARTSSCRFDDRDKTLKGDEKVFISHPAFELQGLGCTVVTNEQRVILHDQVVMILKNAAINGRSLFDRRPAEKTAMGDKKTSH